MKKKSLILLSAIALTLGSCGDSEFEVHQTFFWPQMPGGMTFYADQMEDTTHLYSLDSWKATPSTPDWLSCSPDYLEVTPGTSLSTTMTISTTVNTTGKVRSGVIQVQSHDAVGMPVTQYAWHNVLRPEGKIPNDATRSDLTEMRADFTMELRPTVADTSIVFRTYRAGATLTTDAPWITLRKESTPLSGRDTIPFNLQPNTTGADRTGTITLSSAGVSTPIKVVQKAQ